MNLEAAAAMLANWNDLTVIQPGLLLDAQRVAQLIDVLDGKFDLPKVVQFISTATTQEWSDFVATLAAPAAQPEPEPEAPVPAGKGLGPAIKIAE